ncbi:uncharacterized protein LOC102489438 [Tupaia chinensis]|uniref:Uncharacterized protein n=1 Tax=Tupaia chinensis TaxID=246437 RepID=L9L554_TUPCH|nr:uncharacterized protein LOC102489438 [Tupaia chinensis]ELW68517.1 hypothetical protein TREES_T100008816 [Tupaia chinensis]
MPGHQVSHANTYSHLSHPSGVNRAPGWAPGPRPSKANSFKRPRAPSDSESSSCSSHSEQESPSSTTGLALRKICMGRPYNSKCVETSHLATHPRVARKPSCCSGPHCLLCTDRPSGPSSPSFLDQLIKGINYLDRSTSAFYNNCPKTLSLPRLAANCLERAANSLHLDRSYSSPGACMATAQGTTPSTSMVPSTRGPRALQCLDNSTCLSGSHQPHCPGLSPTLPQRPGIKLPELPLFGHGLFSLGRLPKFWEAIRSGWTAPEPISKPSNWW